MLNIGLLIKNARSEKGLPAKYVAKKLGISEKNYSDIEGGCCQLTLDGARRISKILGISLHDLLTTKGR